MLRRASSSISALNLKLSFSAIALAAAGRAEISSTSRLTLGYFAKAVLAQDEGDHAGPAPHVHVDDGVGVADHVAALGQMVVEDAEMPLRLELVAVMGVVDLLRREVLEVDGLAADTGRRRWRRTSARTAIRRGWPAWSAAGTCRSFRRGRAGWRWSRTP